MRQQLSTMVEGMKEKLLEKTERTKQELLHREERMRQQLVELHNVVVHVFRGAGAINSLSNIHEEVQ